MKRLENIITQLNRLSTVILNELNAEEPSLAAIREQLSQREAYVQELGAIQARPKGLELSKEEVSSLKPMFDVFISMNEEIQNRVSNMMNAQYEKVAVATKQRKIKERYGVQKAPNISYF